MQARLGSSPLIYAPGMIKYAVTMYKTARTPEEVKQAVSIFNAWPITISAMLSILNGDFHVQGSVVVVDLEEDDAEQND